MKGLSVTQFDELGDSLGFLIESAFESDFPSINQVPAYDGDEYWIESFFEHGQWWIRETTDDSEGELPRWETVYSVVDCEGFNGLDFELISTEEYY